VITDELLAFEEGPVEQILQEVKTFRESREKFVAYNLVYKRGILLYGPPGTGKTSIVNLLSTKMQSQGDITLHPDSAAAAIYAIDMIRQVEPSRFVLVVFEEIDKMSRQASSLLSFLDGPDSRENMMALATTNHRDKLPAALINRPSRFDVQMAVGSPSKRNRVTYFEKLGCDTAEAEAWASETKDLTYADLKEVFVSNRVFNRSPTVAIAELRASKSGLQLSQTGGPGLPVFGIEEFVSGSGTFTIE
jgi:ATP-dependent 26S proteasome regulatory subunit